MRHAYQNNCTNKITSASLTSTKLVFHTGRQFWWWEPSIRLAWFGDQRKGGMVHSLLLKHPTIDFAHAAIILSPVDDGTSGLHYSLSTVESCKWHHTYRGGFREFNMSSCNLMYSFCQLEPHKCDFCVSWKRDLVSSLVRVLSIFLNPCLCFTPNAAAGTGFKCSTFGDTGSSFSTSSLGLSYSGRRLPVARRK